MGEWGVGDQELLVKKKLGTSFPSSVLFSSETLVAREMAATRRGWVTAMMAWRPIPPSYRYWGICVVFPEPVSPGKENKSHLNLSRNKLNQKNPKNQQIKVRRKRHKKNTRGTSLAVPMQGPWVQSLVRELDPACRNYRPLCCNKDLAQQNKINKY